MRVIIWCADVWKINAAGSCDQGLIHPVKIHDELIAREIIINDADPGVRYKLTKRQTQEEVCFLFWALRRANRFCDLNKLAVQLNCFCCAKN